MQLLETSQACKDLNVDSGIKSECLAQHNVWPSCIIVLIVIRTLLHGVAFVIEVGNSLILFSY